MRNRPTFRHDDRSALHASASAATRLDLIAVASPVASAIGMRIPLAEAARVIARVADAHADDDWMSREHATVRRDGRTVHVRDGAAVGAGAPEGGAWKPSANGTAVVVAGVATPVVGEVALAPGQALRTGRTLWMVVENAAPHPPGSLIVGLSDALGQVRDELALLVAEVALRFEKKKRVTQSLLVTGPRGSGKQVVAREVHRLLSERRSEGALPFVDMPAPALADGTSAADIFGVVDKYATDVKGRPGYFERAHGGVLLIDEVADLPLGEQAKLLNVLEERQVTRLGGRTPTPFDCLVVAATNRDLPAMVTRGEFRADLYDRLSRFHVHLAPLAERPEDLVPLVHALLGRHSFTGELGWEIAAALLARPWSGNARELDAFIERLVAVARAEGKTTFDQAMIDRAARGLRTTAPQRPSPTPPPAGAAPLLGGQGGANDTKWPTRDELLKCLVDTGWNKSEVARLYGKHPRQITRWMEYLDIKRPDGG